MKKIEPMQQLKSICQKPEQERSKDSWLINNVFRKISIYITKMLLYTPISGNQATMLMTFVGLIAGLFFIFGNYYYSIMGALILLFSDILDCVDGEVARYRGSCSIAGRDYDHLSHLIVDSFLFVCLSFGVFHNINNIIPFIFGYSASLSFAFFAYIDRVIEKLSLIKEKGCKDKNIIAKKEKVKNFKSPFQNIKSKITNTFPIITTALLIGSIFNILYFILIIFGILFPFIFISRILILSRKMNLY